MVNVKYIAFGTAVLLASTAVAEQVPITATVESNCSIYTTTEGVYGQPSVDEITTNAASGGVEPRIRYDVAQAGYYTARISWPDSFSSSPALTDTVTWDGEVTVGEVTDPTMSAYETNKVEYNNVTEFDLTVAGTVWFDVSSTATYGYDRPFPAGNYSAIVTAECIAN